MESSLCEKHQPTDQLCRPVDILDTKDDLITESLDDGSLPLDKDSPSGCNIPAGSKPDLSGKWRIYHSENFEEFLCANGANWLIRKLVKNNANDSLLRQDGDHFFLRVYFFMFHRDETFNIGEPYLQSQPDGSVSEGLAEWDGDSLVVTYRPTDGTNPGQRIERKMISEEVMETIMTTNGVTCRRLASRIT